MEEVTKDQKSTFKEKMEQEKKKFWDMEGSKTTSQEVSQNETPKIEPQKKAKMMSNKILFLVTFVLSVIIFATIFYFLIGK